MPRSWLVWLAAQAGEFARFQNARLSLIRPPDEASLPADTTCIWRKGGRHTQRQTIGGVIGWARRDCILAAPLSAASRLCLAATRRERGESLDGAAYLFGTRFWIGSKQVAELANGVEEKKELLA